MANELQVGISLSFLKNGITVARNLFAQVNVAGSKIIHNTPAIGTSDETLALGDIATNGYLLLFNTEAFVEVTTPVAPTVAVQGTGGAATWTYKIVAKQSDGAYSAASAAGTTAVGNATLTGVNFNRLTWTAVDGADSYDIYRTAHGTSPSTNGLIGNATTPTFDDTGLAGDSATAPATGVDNVILLGANGTSYPIQLKGQDIALFRFSGAAIHAKANTIAADLEYILIED